MLRFFLRLEIGQLLHILGPFPYPITLVIFFFPYNPHPPATPTKPPGRPTREGSISVRFGSVWLRFGSVWLRLAPFRLRFGSVLALFRLRFGSVSGPFGVLGGVGAGSGRGASAREKNITKLHSKAGEKGKTFTGENSKKSSGDGAPKLQTSVPCRGRTCPEGCFSVEHPRSLDKKAKNTLEKQGQSQKG